MRSAQHLDRVARALLVISVGGAAACGGDTPAGAVYAVGHDLEHGVIDGACARILSSTALPRGVARSLQVAHDEPSARNSGDVERRTCVRRLEVEGAVEQLGFHEPRVRSVTEVAVVQAGKSPPRHAHRWRATTTSQSRSRSSKRMDNGLSSCP